jgi:hypothetical protein
MGTPSIFFEVKIECLNIIYVSFVLRRVKRKRNVSTVGYTLCNTERHGKIAGAHSSEYEDGKK